MENVNSVSTESNAVINLPDLSSNEEEISLSVALPTSDCAEEACTESHALSKDIEAFTCVSVEGGAVSSSSSSLEKIYLEQLSSEKKSSKEPTHEIACEHNFGTWAQNITDNDCEDEEHDSPCLSLDQFSDNRYSTGLDMTDKPVLTSNNTDDIIPVSAEVMPVKLPVSSSSIEVHELPQDVVPLDDSNDKLNTQKEVDTFVSSHKSTNVCKDSDLSEPCVKSVSSEFSDKPSCPVPSDINSSAVDLLPLDSQLEMLLAKKDVYLKLKNWEEDRLTRSEHLHQLLDPLIDELTTGIQASKETNNQMIRYFKDRVKLNRDLVSKLRNNNSKILRHQHRTTDMNDSSKLSEQQLDMSNKHGTGRLHIDTTSWVIALHKSNDKEATYIEGFGDMIDSNLVQGNLIQANTDYDQATTAIVYRLQEVRLRLKSQSRDVLKSWGEFQHQFKELEKAQYGKKRGASMQSKTTLTNDRGNPIVSSTSTISSSSPSNQITVSPPGRDHRDCWLFERRYFHTVMANHQLEIAYFRLMSEAISEFRQLERWRTTMIKDIVLHYLSKMRETLGLIASSLGSVHSAIDPAGFLKARAAFLARHPDTPLTDTTSTLSLQPTLKEEIDVTNTMSPKEGEEEQQQQPVPSSVINKENEDSANNVISQEYNLEIDSLLATAKDIIGEARVPEPRLVIKTGQVRRHAGLFGKWSEGILVLTWDRFLHMFRSHDDSQPLWSVFMPSVEVHVIEEKSGGKTVEVKERRNLFVVLGSRSFYFRAFSELDLGSWLGCLSLASSADDREYRLEGIANAKSADAAVLDDYAAWSRKPIDDLLPERAAEEFMELSDTLPISSSNGSRDSDHFSDI